MAFKIWLRILLCGIVAGVIWYLLSALLLALFARPFLEWAQAGGPGAQWSGAGWFIIDLMGFRYPAGPPGLIRPDEPEIKAYRDASPTTHVTREDAPFLLIHGDADSIVPINRLDKCHVNLTNPQISRAA